MSEPATSAPSASKHVFLNELSTMTTGSKVRFLCCVTSYDVLNGHLTVEYTYPYRTGHTFFVEVDVNLVLDNIQPDILSVGTWINVIGYTRTKGTSDHKKRQVRSRSLSYSNEIFVQAVLAWDAGPVKLDEYEEVLTRQKDALKAAKQG